MRTLILLFSKVFLAGNLEKAVEALNDSDFMEKGTGTETKTERQKSSYLSKRPSVG